MDSKRFASRRALDIPPSGIRKFFDIVATMKDVISLGIGEPDFDTPEPVVAAGVTTLQAGETHYTSNSGLIELREALNLHMAKLYNVAYDPEMEILITVGVSEGLDLALRAVVNPGDEVIYHQPSYV